MLAGVDVSEYNGLASTAGLAFAFARATYGPHLDERYDAHAAHFRAAHIVLGAYHFGVGWATPDAQADAFLAGALGADLFALDLETDKTKTMTEAQARAFIGAVHRRGKRIGLYHSESGFPGDLGQDWNWRAKWTSLGRVGLNRPRSPWAFWQWQGTTLDRDWFNGDRAALLHLAGLATERSVRVSGAWWQWDFDPVTRRVISRVSRHTGGFSATIGSSVRITYAGNPHELAELHSGAYEGSWVDLLDAGSVTVKE